MTRFAWMTLAVTLNLALAQIKHRFLVVDNGNVLLSLAGSHKVVEVNSTGGVVWTATLTDKAYVALRHTNGHTRATSGEDCRVYDLDATGNATLVAGSLEKFPNARLLWFSGFEVLPNGH